MKLKAVFVFITVLTIPFTLWAHSGATGIVKVRMDNFKESKASMKLLKKAVRNQDFLTISQEAQSINLWAKKLVEHFPAASNNPPSEALDLIWQEFDRFTQYADTQINASAGLHKAGLNEDADAVKEAFSDLAKSCKACHDDYRE